MDLAPTFIGYRSHPPLQLSPTRGERVSCALLVATLSSLSLAVIPGLDPGDPRLGSDGGSQDVGGRTKSGHDVEDVS